MSGFFGSLLYHTKNYQGTTTSACRCPRWRTLYHTKNYQGTTTIGEKATRYAEIIPYQELPGNYNLHDTIAPWMIYYTIPRTTRELQRACVPVTPVFGLYHTKNYQGTTTLTKYTLTKQTIIPYQELPGNYNIHFDRSSDNTIIPYQELPGNYNEYFFIPFIAGDYTIPRTTRELQLVIIHDNAVIYYTIPRTTRELQLQNGVRLRLAYYTIPRTTRELQHTV